MVEMHMVRPVTLPMIMGLMTSACVPGQPTAPTNGQAVTAAAADPGERRPAMKLLTYAAPANMPHQAIGMQGVLEVRKGCLILRADGTDYLLYFPRGMAVLDPSDQALRQDDVRIPIGARIAIDGTGYRNPGNLTMLDDPGACDAEHVFVAFPGRIRLL